MLFNWRPENASLFLNTSFPVRLIVGIRNIMLSFAEQNTFSMPYVIYRDIVFRANGEYMN